MPTFGKRSKHNCGKFSFYVTGWKLICQSGTLNKIEYFSGNIGVLLINLGNEDYEVKRGDRIAQLICECCVQPELKEVETLDTTDRGEDGFGSTGI